MTWKSLLAPLSRWLGLWALSCLCLWVGSAVPLPVPVAGAAAVAPVGQRLGLQTALLQLPVESSSCQCCARSSPERARCAPLLRLLQRPQGGCYTREPSPSPGIFSGRLQCSCGRAVWSRDARLCLFRKKQQSRRTWETRSKRGPCYLPSPVWSSRPSRKTTLSSLNVYLLARSGIADPRWEGLDPNPGVTHGSREHHGAS